MTSEMGDDDFDARWRALESPYRRRIAALANSGRTSGDPLEASLVLGYARRRLHPLELWGVMAVVVVAYAAVAQVFFGGPDALIVALLIGAVAVLFLIRRTRLETAISKSEEAIRNAPVPGPLPGPEQAEIADDIENAENADDDQDPVA